MKTENKQFETFFKKWIEENKIKIKVEYEKGMKDAKDGVNKLKKNEKGNIILNAYFEGYKIQLKNEYGNKISNL